MAILRPALTPFEIPQQIVAPPRRRRRTMMQPGFYLQEETTKLAPQSPVQPQEQTSQQQDFLNAPETGNNIADQIARFRQTAAPPSLQPSARVRSPSSELINPDAFKSFFDRLATIKGMGENQLAIAQANATANKYKSPSGGGGGQAWGNAIPSNPQANFKFAQQIAPQYGWSAQELQAWYTLGMKESGWKNTAQNPKSTAYGIGQFLDSTWGTVGGKKTSDPYLQVKYMAEYIRKRYGSPSRALAFHLRNNWY